METNKPQMILDDLHAIGIPEFYSADISPVDRKASIKLAKQKLKLVKKNLNQEMKSIKAKYDGRNQVEASIEQNEIEPYNVLENLVDRLEIALSELEIRNTPGDAPLFEEHIIKFDDGWRIVGVEGVLEKVVLNVRTRMAETLAMIEKAEARLRVGFVIKATCGLIGIMVGMIMIFLLLGDFIMSNNSSNATDFDSFPLCGGILVVYLLGGMLFGIRRIPNATQTRHKLLKGREDVGQIEKALDTVTTDDHVKLGQFILHLQKVESFARFC